MVQRQENNSGENPLPSICNNVEFCGTCELTGKLPCKNCSGSGTVSSSYIDYYTTDCAYYDGQKYLSCGKSENLTYVCGY